jgi:hypothetical protein
VRLLVDTDTASDDAVALLLALRTPGVEVDAITIVAGNVEVEKGVQAALYTVELAGADVRRRRPRLRRPYRDDPLRLHGARAGRDGRHRPAPAWSRTGAR